MNIRIPFMFITLLMAPIVMAEDIAGFWKHAEEPGWIEVRVEDGVGKGVVVRNDVYPERVGRELLKNLRADAKKQDLWRGQVYAEKLGEYKDAEISLPESGQMEIKVKVGFMSRTLDWVRVDRVPA
ncbi:MAG: DUF2147 domain-containing protein, partial [Gammaproteobacteria bacterium]|nr:DUF2147 domain-containing protein [Gammaproteobacteria bacterium]